MTDGMNETNWAGNYQYAATRIHRPTTIDEVAAIVMDAQKLRVVGSRHSFTDIVDSTELISLADLEERPRLNADARTVTVPAHWTYGDVARYLHPHGLALHNLASLPHISVAGAVATATHGSGTRNGNLATAVAGLEIVNTSGEILHVDRSTPDFEGMIVSLGGLGIVTMVTLDVVFDYAIEQHVFDGIPLDVCVQTLDEILSTAYSVSLFTTFRSAGQSSGHGDVGQVWIKRRADGSDRSVRPGPTFLGVRVATEQRHPIPSGDANSCTGQLGVVGPWIDRLPHFRVGFTPSFGNEVQSEFFVSRADGAAALDALRSVSTELSEALMVCEVRAVAADELWMSPQYERDSVAFHFTWQNDAALVDAAVTVVEGALARFDPRPHWGKVFHTDAFSARDSYEMLDDFVELARRVDPHGVFDNNWWHRNIHP